MWLPSIQSAEEFIESLSGLKQADEIDLLAHLYESYLACMSTEPEPFDKFSKWGHLMIQDFNEIDRYLINSEQIYQNLRDIKEIENWSLGEKELTATQQNYLAFMSSIGNIYKHFNARLMSLGIGYQGLIYRQASEKFKEAEAIHTFDKILFCGFNALNAAETKIYKRLLEAGKAEMLWDIDTYYLKDQNQEAGLFLRRNLEIFPQKDPKFIADHFKEPKTIEITAVAGQHGQAQLVHDTLMRLLEQDVPMSKVAVVLANEKLLWPVLKALPQNIEHVNITMEYPIRYTQAYSFIDLLMHVQVQYQSNNRHSGALYHKDFISIVQHSMFGTLLQSLNSTVSIHRWVDLIHQNNFAYLSQKFITELTDGLPVLIRELFMPWENSHMGNEILKRFISTVRDHYITLFQHNTIHLEIEYLEVLMRSFNRITEVLTMYTHYHDVKAFKQLYQQTVGSATVPFIGEPLRGLQIMGVLETRTLDFEYLIMVGVNEGVLPSGKTVNSFLPNDLKRVFGLPLYYEKDAIYAYHFYRLLQRSKEVYLIHDSETDELGKGEKSRFITQLEFELKRYQPAHSIHQKVAISASPSYQEAEIKIPKTDITLARILERAKSDGEYGSLSPSALITLKECSLKYYYRYGIGLKELKEVEESAEANTFGSILHLALETIYKPLLGQVLNEEDVLQLIPGIDKIVEEAFKMTYRDVSQLTGKNLLQIEVLKAYVRKMLDQDIATIKDLGKKNRHLTLMYLEQEWKAPLTVEVDGKQVRIYVKGKIDRIDKCGDEMRVIDYKSSIKSTDKFQFKGFSELMIDTDQNKLFQLFTYVWLLWKNKPEYLTMAAPGIIPFKKFLKEPKGISDENKKKLQFNEEIIQEFEGSLSEFVSSLFDKKEWFVQTDDEAVCEYCGYKSICNR